MIKMHTEYKKCLRFYHMRLKNRQLSIKIKRKDSSSEQLHVVLLCSSLCVSPPLRLCVELGVEEVVEAIDARSKSSCKKGRTLYECPRGKIGTQ